MKTLQRVWLDAAACALAQEHLGSGAYHASFLARLARGVALGPAQD